MGGSCGKYRASVGIKLFVLVRHRIAIQLFYIRSMRLLIFVLLLLISVACVAQVRGYGAGFRAIDLYDSGRLYKPGSERLDRLHYRPISFDLWYPAEVTGSDTAVLFGELVSMLEQRSTLYDDSRRYYGLTEEMLAYICAGVDCPHVDSLRQRRTNSYGNARRIGGRFPLILYLSGFNSTSYENYALFEALVKEGFIVAAVGSAGRYPGHMTLDTADVAEQVADAKYVLRYLVERALVCPDTVGLVGYSWGGLAAAILAMQGGVRAVVSLDGSEQFVYADPDEAEQLNVIRNADFFTPGGIKASYLYLDSEGDDADHLPDSVYNFVDFIRGDTFYLKVDHATHEDFSSFGLLAGSEHARRYMLIEQLTVSFLLDKLTRRGSFEQGLPGRGLTRRFTQPRGSAPAGDGTVLLKGVIKDPRNRPLPYVNIGIAGKDQGTTSDVRGEFALRLSAVNVQDTLRVSMIGYAPDVILLKPVLEKQKPFVSVRLREKVYALNDVVVTGKKLTEALYGNGTTSRFFGGKFASGDLGSEMAIRIRIKKRPTYLDAFSFTISYNMGDTAAFRVNIYTVVNGLPGDNILSESIITRINNQTGTITVDLSPYHIMVQDDFFIGLEWIEGKTNTGIVFSAALANRHTYYRKASHGRWKRHPLGVGFRVRAKY